MTGQARARHPARDRGPEAARDATARDGAATQVPAGEATPGEATPGEVPAGEPSAVRAAAGDAVLETHGLAVGYPDRQLLRGLDISLPSGRLTCLLGPNGSGKTTLLRTLAGMLPPLAGSVELCGQPLAGLSALERARRMAVVLTGTVDTGLLRAVDLVSLGRYPHTGWGGRLRARDRDAVAWALAVSGAERFADRAVATLSDGERQRVLIARALAQEPRVLALDEPTAFVDVPRRAELGDLLGHLARECGLAVLMTTHDLDLALRVADDVWLLETAGEDRLLHRGGPEDLALSGAVGRAFASADVEFDTARGRFVPCTAPLARARLIGDGDRAMWAARALERAGWGLTAAGEPPALTVRMRPDGWEVSSAEGTQTVPLLADVAERARAALSRVSDFHTNQRGQH